MEAGHDVRPQGIRPLPRDAPGRVTRSRTSSASSTVARRPSGRAASCSTSRAAPGSSGRRHVAEERRRQAGRQRIRQPGDARHVTGRRHRREEPAGLLLLGLERPRDEDPALRTGLRAWRHRGHLRQHGCPHVHRAAGRWTIGTWLDRATYYAGSPQSLTGDLIREGVTGVAGHVAEPFLDAAIRPDILFPAYVSGFNLAESFYLAMPYLSWQAVVIGDPLCAPFPRKPLQAADIDKGIDPATELPALLLGEADRGAGAAGRRRWRRRGHGAVGGPHREGRPRRQPGGARGGDDARPEARERAPDARLRCTRRTRPTTRPSSATAPSWR